MATPTEQGHLRAFTNSNLRFKHKVHTISLSAYTKKNHKLNVCNATPSPNPKKTPLTREKNTHTQNRHMAQQGVNMATRHVEIPAEYSSRYNAQGQYPPYPPTPPTPTRPAPPRSPPLPSLPKSVPVDKEGVHSGAHLLLLAVSAGTRGSLTPGRATCCDVVSQSKGPVAARSSSGLSSPYRVGWRLFLAESVQPRQGLYVVSLW